MHKKARMTLYISRVGFIEMNTVCIECQSGESEEKRLCRSDRVLDLRVLGSFRIIFR